MSDLIRTISGNKKFIENLKTKNIAFRLVGAYTKTCEIDNISFAGLPGMLHYTPAADMEALFHGKTLCMSEIPKSPVGPPSPVILSLAIKNIFDFPTYFIDAGLKIRPCVPLWNCDVDYSESILNGANVETEKLIEKANEYIKKIDIKDLEIIAECVPGGTTTAYSLCKSLGYDCDNLFSGSVVESNNFDLKKSVVNKAIEKFGLFEEPKLCCKYYGDNMQPFVAALASVLSLNTKVVLAGGTQMLAVYALIKKLKLNVDFDNIAIITTRWVVDDRNSNFKKLANLIDNDLNAFCSDFSMNSEIENLALYEKGFVKEGVGAGALIAYAFANGVINKRLLNDIENIYLNF